MDFFPTVSMLDADGSRPKPSRFFAHAMESSHGQRQNCRFDRASQRRRERGHWQETELGTRANLSESTIRDFEKGRRVPTVNNLAAIRAALKPPAWSSRTAISPECG